MCLTNRAIRNYLDTNLLFCFALLVGRDRNRGNKQNMVLYWGRGSGFIGLQ
jgi:hypothetical protein